MWPIRFLLAIGLSWLSVPCSANLILTLTPTARVDFETQVLISYTLTGRASGPAPQNVGDFQFQVRTNTFPTPSNMFLVDNPNVALTGPWTNTNFGTRTAFLTFSSGNVSAVVFDGFGPLTDSFSTISTTGGVVGTFDIRWNRPVTGQYDAAIPASAISGDYTLTVGGFNFLPVTVTSPSPGVSTVITAVPEPGTMVLITIASCGMLWRVRYKKYATRKTLSLDT